MASSRWADAGALVWLACPSVGTASQWPAQGYCCGWNTLQPQKVKKVWWFSSWPGERIAFLKGTFLNSGSLMPTQWWVGKAVGSRRPGSIYSSVYTSIAPLSNAHSTCQVRRKVCLWRHSGAGDSAGGGRLCSLPYLPFLYNLFLPVDLSCRLCDFPSLKNFF